MCAMSSCLRRYCAAYDDSMRGDIRFYKIVERGLKMGENEIKIHLIS